LLLTNTRLVDYLTLLVQKLLRLVLLYPKND
jgi:hypothetical protein